jgi:hypothetical protein
MEAAEWGIGNFDSKQRTTEMRYMIAATLAIAVNVAPAFAEDNRPAPARVELAPTFDDCFRLAWVRGVHVERGELEAFNEDCMANRVPFETGNPSDSIVRKPH